MMAGLVGVHWWRESEPDNSGKVGDGEDSGRAGDRRRDATID